MAKKKKIEKVGTIKAIDTFRQTRPMQDIPFRTGAHENKKYKREKINKNKLDKWLQIDYNITIEKREEKKEMDKAERLAQIMFEEDENRYNNNEETIYFTKEDFEAEQKERKDK